MRLSEGVYLDVYNMHTCAGTTDSSLSARQDNINQLVAYIKENSANNAVIVTGDTNARYTRSGDNIRTLLAAMDNDVWVEKVEGGVAPAIGSAALVWESTDILPSLGYEFVDKIFYRSNAYIDLSAASYDVLDATFRDSSGNMLSDHRPVYAAFTYALNASLKLSDQFGGPHGTSYSDVNDIPASPRVTAIGLRAGSRVDQVSATLSTGTTFSHGGTGGTARSLTLNSGEYVTSLTVDSGKKNDTTRIFYAKFTTSQGRTLSGGTTTNDTATYTAPSGWQIVGFHGRSADEVDKVGVIYSPIN
jgi:hypothetical protein